MCPIKNNNKPREVIYYILEEDFKYQDRRRPVMESLIEKGGKRLRQTNIT